MNPTVFNKKTERDSNMELLRIIAMILVMIVHANFRALPVPTTEECNLEITSSILRFLTESISIICVNLFILLSGWYGIRYKISRLLEFLFQVFFFSILCCVIYYSINPIDNKITSIIANLLLLKQWSYWFVKAYIGLYIFAPILNSFIENASKQQLKVFLVSFYTFQTIYGWVSPNAAIYFESGYSAISFMGLYVLARYIHLYPMKLWTMNRKWDIVIYGVIVIITTLITFILKKFNLSIGDRFFIYSSPLVIISAVHFMLFFTKFKFHNKYINWIASSCFGIYLLHSNSFLAKPFYDNIILNWFNNLPTLNLLFYTIPFITFIFTLAILIDKIRIYIWIYIKRIIKIV